MARTKTAEQKVPLTQEDLDRFHRNAPAALAHRGTAYMWEESLAGLQTALFGSLPVLGLLFWGWSAADMLLFLLVGAWVGILCDAAKVCLLLKRAEAFAQSKYDNFHVWTVVGALRDGSNEAYPSHIQARWQPFGGIFIDFVMGGISTVIILVLLVVEAGLGVDSLQTPSVLLVIGGMSLLRFGETVWEILHHRANDHATGGLAEGPSGANPSTDNDRPVKAAVGLRGVGLFLLLFLTVFLTDKENGASADVAWVTMLVVNGLIVLYGLLTLVGPLWLIGETRWLRNYLSKKQAALSAAGR